MFTLQALMRLPQFSRFWTFKPDRTRAALRPLRCCYFQGSGGRTDGLSDPWPTPPAHTTHWQAQRKPPGWMWTRQRRRGIREKGTRVGTGSPEAAEFYFCARNKLFHAVVSVASSNGTRRKNRQHWVSSHLSANDSSLGFPRTHRCYFNQIPHENKCF